MQRSNPSVLVLDARAPEFYSGAQKGMMSRAGRVPGAVNAPYTSFFDEQGKFRPREQLLRLLRADGTAPQPLRVTYCHIGQQATVPYFASRLLGLEVRLFDGSYQEWSQRTEFPVETDPPSGK
jgi:thiosulfate/3-mercaptopyruvate sulfurtransferase